MNILYIGAGFVGACSAAVSADSGHTTLAFDIDQKKIEKLRSCDRAHIESCIFEDGLAELLTRHKDRIRFTFDYAKVERFLDACDGVFMCLPTPEIGETGESDLSYYNAACERLAQALVKRNNGAQEKYIVVVNKSTVPIDMVAQTQTMLGKAGAKNFGVVSNPEFLVEGKAIEGSIHPDRGVVGAWQEKDFDIMRRIYDLFYNCATVQYLEVNPKEAAAGKLLSNFYLFSKLAAWFDVLGRPCEAYADLRFEQVSKIIIAEKGIGNWGFYDSLYAGGSCLIKDARSLSHQLQTAGKDAVVVNETYLANKRQLEIFLGLAERDAGFSWLEKRVALAGTAFKRDTNDIRNSPSIDIMHFLQERQVRAVNVYDPAALPMFQDLFPESERVHYMGHEFDAVKNVDAIIIATDWPQFRGLADAIVGELKNRPLIMDGRRMLQHRYRDLQEAGFDIVAVGSPFLKHVTRNT